MKSTMDNKKTRAELNEHLRSWTSTPIGRREFLAAAGWLLASCATVDKNRRLREGDNSGQDISLTPEDEKQLTKEVLPQMQKDYPPLQNPGMQTYISNLGKKIAAASQLEGNPYNYSFTVVDVNMVNAFALPAGTIYVTAPLIAMAETESELAGVIGHEIGHIKARHSAERMEKAKREQSSSWKYALGGGLLGAAVGFGLGKLACPPKDNECLNKAAQLGAAAGVGGTLLIQKYAFMANSREDEMEADRIGFRTATAAGYHKDHVGSFYAKLLKMEQDRKGNDSPFLKSLSDALSTHPPSQERVQQMNELAAATPLQPKSIVNSSEFENYRKLARALGTKTG